MEKKLQGKTALITGGNSGIGLATAKLFAAHGAQVIIAGRDPDSLQTAKDAIGENCRSFQCDVSSRDELSRLFSSLGSQTRLDILFANAAVAQPAPFEAVTEEQFDSTVSINFKGTFFTIQQALPFLASPASIIVTTSITNQMGSPHFSVYGACKAALRSLVQTLGLELIGRGVRLNAISPGPIATPMFSRLGLPSEAEAIMKAAIEQKSPIKRFADPDEVARLVLFLASDDSSYVVGEEIVIDGGMSLL